MALFRWRSNDAPIGGEDSPADSSGKGQAVDGHNRTHDHPDTSQDLTTASQASHSRIHYGRTRDDIGPYEDEHPNPELPTLSFGALEMPMIDGMEYIPSFDHNGDLHTLSIIVGNQCAEFTLFAARKTPGLWMSSYGELNDSAEQRGFTTFPLTGVWGKELLLRPKDNPNETSYLFAGIEGVGYLLRICYFGAAAEEDEARALIDRIVENIIVHRDSEMRKPGTVINLELPEILRQAMDKESDNSAK